MLNDEFSDLNGEDGEDGEGGKKGFWTPQKMDVRFYAQQEGPNQ